MAESPDLHALVQQLVDAFNRGDGSEETMRYFAPDAVWDASRIGMGVAVIEGVPKIQRLLDDFYGRFDDANVELTEFQDFGNGITFALLTSEGRVPGADRVVAEHGAHIYEWADGRVVRVIDYRDIDEARAVAERLAKERA